MAHRVADCSAALRIFAEKGALVKNCFRSRSPWTIVATLMMSVISDNCVTQKICSGDEPTKAVSSPQQPLSDDERKKFQKQWDDGIAELTKKLEAKSDDLASLSKRGDLHFFRGDFKDSVRDYEQMCEVNSEMEASHWRLGIVYYYAGQPEKSAKLFDRFYQTDDVDRECGLWKFLGDAKAADPQKARERLLKYSKSDREPLPSIYRLFDGTSTPDELVKSFRDAKLTEPIREQRSFYVELYLGLWHDAHGRTKDALPHFFAATANAWPRSAGYGPNYMWHVARLHYEQLAAAK